ncbi:hypothetical protein [Fluviicola taffensis]|uniref:hypothetical protein n=1 Tax=Fluviicola taffensis TaxID=191579 RepID=UPI00313807BB
MLTLIPIYLFGKSYYELAKLHNRSAWGYAFLGAFIFLGAQFVLGFLFGLLILTTNIDLDIPDFALSLIAIVFGAACTYGIENLLKRKWERQPKADSIESDLLDQ